jgi:hypothetical protein
LNPPVIDAFLSLRVTSPDRPISHEPTTLNENGTGAERDTSKPNLFPDASAGEEVRFFFYVACPIGREGGDSRFLIEVKPNGAGSE